MYSLQDVFFLLSLLSCNFSLPLFPVDIVSFICFLTLVYYKEAHLVMPNFYVVPFDCSLYYQF